MKDRVPVNPGRVRIVPENGSAAFYATMERADNPTQEGTPINKNTLLKDATAAKFGLGGDAVPDEALNLLSRLHSGLANEYVWKKQSYVPPTYTQESLGSGKGYTGSTDSVPQAQVSDEITVADDGTVTLVNPTTVTITSAATAQTGLAGKYFIRSGGSWSTYIKTNTVYYCPADATFENKYYGGVYYYYTSSDLLVISGVAAKFAPAGYVNSPDPNAYPASAAEFVYEALGQMGDKTRIAKGSYIGTGTYGKSNPNSLTFDFVPKIVIIVYSGVAVFLWGSSGTYERGSAATNFITTNTNTHTVSYADIDRTMTWYSTSDAIAQLNASNTEYNYIIIG